MLSSVNALELFTRTNPSNKSNAVFNNKDTNLLCSTKQTSNKKRSFNEIGTSNDYPSKAKRALKNRGPVKTQLMGNLINYKVKQLEKNGLQAIVTGIHPTLKKAKDEISKIGIKLKKVEEQSTFWREKTLKLQKQLLSSKNSVAHLSEKVVKLEVERVLLQNKVTTAEENTNAILVTMRNLMAENKGLKETINHMDEELKMEDAAKSEEQVVDGPEQNTMLEKALEDTLTDLSDRLDEIEELKKLLAKVAIEKNLLEKQVVKKQIIAEIVNLDEGDADDQNSSRKISKLEDAVEKCMFRISVLTQKNEELKKNSSFRSDQDTRLMDLLEDDEKLHLLETACMKRFRKLLTKAGEKFVIQEDSDESFTK